MVYHVSVQRLGQFAGHVKSTLGHVDKGIHYGARVFHAVKPLLPDGKLKSTAEKGLSDYETVRQRVRNAGLNGRGSCEGDINWD